MKSRPKFLICASLSMLLLLLVAGRSAQAQSIWTNTDAGSLNLWQDAANWTPSGVPTTATTAQFDDTGANSVTPLTLGNASVGTLNFLNSVNNYTLGSSTSDTLTFGGANALNQSGGATTTNNTIAAQIIVNGLTANISSGTLNLTNAANSIDSTSTFNVSNNATLNVTASALGAAGVALNSGNLVLGGGGATNFNGLLGNFWALSPGQSATSEGNGTNSSYWGAVNLNDNTSVGVIHGVLATAGAPVVVNNVLPNNIAQITPVGGTSSGGATYTAPTYGAPNNPFGGAAPATGYVGGIDFPQSVNAQNAFGAIGVNISGTNGANAGAAGGYSPTVAGTTTVAQYNNIMADWSGTVTLAHAGVLNFNLDSDDASFILVDGKVVDMRLNQTAGGGFTGNGSGGQGTAGATVALSAGAHTIEVAYDQGNGGWGVVGMYNFTPTGGAAGPTNYIGNDDTTTADGVAFSSTLYSSGVNNSNPISSSGASSLEVNIDSAASVGVLTLNDATNLTITGTAPSLSFASTTITGATATFTNSMAVEPGLITATGGLTNLTMAGSSILYLDNTGNSSAFNSGVTITSANAAGTVVGVNVGGVDSLGAATLAVAGGNFSLGTDNGTNTFANPIAVSGSGGTITGQPVGAGTANSGQTISLSGGIALNGPLTLATSITNISLTAPIVGGNSLTYGSGGNSVNLTVANAGFTGTYNANTGTTNDNVVGGLTNNSTNINNGSTVNINAPGETLGTTSVNNGYLALTQGNINIANTTIQAGGQLNLIADQGVNGSGGAGIAPTAAIQGTVYLQNNISSGYNLTMANNSTFGGDGGSRSFSSNLALQGNTNLGTNNNSFTLAGALTGAGGVTQNGTGTTTIGNTATAGYGGATNVNSGTLALQTNLTGGGAVNVNGAAATLNVQSAGLGASPVTSIGAVNLTGAGASLGSGAVSMTGAGAALTFNAGASNTASYTGSSIGLTNGATLQVTSGAANLGPAIITGDNFSATPGLLEGRILNNANALTSPNPGNGGIQLGPLAAYTNTTTSDDGSTTPVSAHEWSNNNTWQYTGEIYITANEAANGITFAKNIDDDTQLQIDGHTYISSTTWDSPAGAYITGLTQGWHEFSLIMGNGNGGAGWVASTNDNFGGAIISSLPGSEASLYTSLSVGLGFGYADGNPFNFTANATTQGTPANAGASLNPMFDSGTGNLFQVVTSMGSTIGVAASTSLTAGSIASAQTLNLNGGLTLNSGATASNSVVQQVTVAAGAAATLNLGSNNVFAPIATSIADGGGSLTLNGPGRFEVGSGATFTIGQTDSTTSLAVTSGTFRVDMGGAVSGPGSITVSGSGILAGGGTVGVNTVVGSGGTLAPGDAANMTVSALMLNSGSNLSYNLSVPGQLGPGWGGNNDLVSVTSSLILSTSPGAITVNIPTTGFGGAGTYELLSYGSTNTTNVNEFITGTVPALYTYTFVSNAAGNQFDLIVSAVPEPSTIVLFGMGLAGLFVARRRRAKRAA